MITADSILRDLETYVYRTVSVSHSEKTALACARALVECLFLNFRAQSMYVPTRDIKDTKALQSRYERIWADFNGHNHNELACKYRLSVQRIYAIINRMRAVCVRQRQRDLFPVPDEPSAQPLTLTILDEYLPADLERAGLPADDAKQLAGAVATHLCATYPGISVRITEALWQKRHNPGNDDLFDPG